MKWISVLIALILGAPALAGQGPGYRYGECWWQEYAPDDATALLLHFGRPQVPPVQTMRAIVKGQKPDFDLNKSGLAEGPDEGGPEPIDDANVPADTVLDYSAARQVLQLGAGVAPAPAGRFGAALAFTGTGRLQIDGIPGVGPVECWFKVAALPKTAACLFSLAKDESRLLLRPDGRLELVLKRPHGMVSANLSAAQREAILARDAAIVSEVPITLNTWHHVVVFNENHVVQGAGAPFDATIRLDGVNVAHYLSENNNSYAFMGRPPLTLVLGNNAAGDQGFTGIIDEVRVSSTDRGFYDRDRMPWRDNARPVQFNRPFFRRDGTAFHASLDHGTRYDLGAAGDDIVPNLQAGTADKLVVEGVRGQGWVIDPMLGLPKFSIAKLSAERGSLEFWLHPVNWDDMTGYWQHSPPKQKDLTVLRLFGTDAQDKKEKPFLAVTLPRAYNLERARVPVDPGHWLHCVLVWGHRADGKASLYVNGGYLAGIPFDAALIKRVTPTVAIFGVPDAVRVQRDDVPVIEIDEVVGYTCALAEDEVAQARQRWMGTLEPIKLYTDSFSFKWSLQRLDFSLTPQLPEGVTPTALRVSLADAATGKTVCAPVTVKELTDKRFVARLSDGTPLPFGKYQFRFAVLDEAGKPAVEGTRDWTYEEEPWRHCTAGILDTVPAPWTPLVVTPTRVQSRMSAYTLGADGLPAQITADGADLLAGPMQLLENGTPLKGTTAIGAAKPTEANWESTFTGATTGVRVRSHVEYDGMLKYEITLAPKGPVGALTLQVPVKAAFAKRYLYHAMGDRGVRTGVGRQDDGVLFESRFDPVPYEQWKGYLAARAKDPALSWDAYWAPKKAAFTRYNFYGHLDLNDMNRGLWWFCDNAAGWKQSTEISAIRAVRKGDTVLLQLNLVAEPGAYAAGKPIVFAFLPHPARPQADYFRRIQRVDPKDDPKLCDVFDAFRPWPMDPRWNNPNHMTLFPAPDPKKPEAGPSWSYAESCLPSMTLNKPTGLRTMYLSRAWFSCRAGAYDNWEWRSGEMMAASLTPSFVNYLCWEMDGWLKRGIWEAIYLDECYETPTRNVEAGQAVLLHDGTVQAGVTNFQFRELMKRWRNLFTAYGKPPMVLAHHTYSWQYPGLLYCDGNLDGENRPIVSLNSKDWLDSTSLRDFENVQNARLWGIPTFYMPFIAEGGFNNKEKSTYPRWQWRMARQAQSMFAHFETATVYEGQGSQVYRGFWRDVLGWGAGDLAVTFHPYWDNAALVQAAGQGDGTLVSLYKAKGKVLLIVSNRETADRVIPITLKLAALGLPANVTAKNLDATLKPPAGEDYIPNAAPVDPEGPEEEPEEAPALDLKAPLTVVNGVVHVPVRARDYRVITLE